MASLPLMARCCNLSNDVTSEGPRGDGEFASKEAGFAFGSLEQGAETAWNQRVDLGLLSVSFEKCELVLFRQFRRAKTN